MSFYNEDIRNIIIPQIQFGESFYIREIKPRFTSDSSCTNVLSLNENRELIWIPYILNLKNSSTGYSILNNIEGNTAIFNDLRASGDIILRNEEGTIVIDSSISFTEGDKLKGTNLYCFDDRIGFGRKPLNQYKFDIGIPKDTLTTAFHVGDGSAGFSMGNGTSAGFIPQIIGMGIDENDAGLYFIGRAGNNITSSIPLVIIDGRNIINNSLTNRPIFGVTSGSYSDYKFLINYNGNTYIDGKIYASDLVIDSEISSLKDTIKQLQEEIKKIKDSLTIS